MIGFYVALGAVTVIIIGLSIYALNKGYSRKWDED